MIYKAKKSLGQNFLKSEIALKKIIEAGEVTKDDVILEIGPGKGALTEKLLQTGAIVIAVEKDRELFELLKIKFEKEISSGQLKLINADILEFSVEQNILERTLGRSGDDGQRKFSAENFRGESENILCNYKLIANIPYNITGAILKKFLTEKHQPKCMVLMIQHEVASRIVATNGKESILSISVKAYGEPKMIMKVDKRYFSPAPKVNSAIIKISNISRKNFLPLPSLPLSKGEVPKAEGVFEEKFWEIVKAGFAHKRKKLSGNLKWVISPEKLSVMNLENKRAEDLKLEDWLNLAK